MNKPGDPVIGVDKDWQRYERNRLNFNPIKLTKDQRSLIEDNVPLICQRGGWQFHICAAETDHVHTLHTGSEGADGKTIRRLLKRWLSQHLSKEWSLPSGATWWAEGGSVKWVWTQSYFETCYEYIAQQRINAQGVRSIIRH